MYKGLSTPTHKYLCEAHNESSIWEPKPSPWDPGTLTTDEVQLRLEKKLSQPGGGGLVECRLDILFVQGSLIAPPSWQTFSFIIWRLQNC